MLGPRPRCSALFGCAAWVLIGRAGADVDLARLDIGWSAPAGCPDDRAIRAAIDALIPDAAALATGAENLAFRGAVTRERERWILRAESGSRASPQAKTIEAESCGALSEAFALIVAFAIDPGARAGTTPAAGVLGEPASLADPPPAPADEAPSTEKPVDAGGSGFFISFGPLAAAGVGLLPSAAMGWGAAIAAGTGAGSNASGARLRWELAGLLWPEQTALLSGSSAGVGVRTSLLSVEPSMCVALGHSFVAACLGAGIGAMRATGVVASPASRTSWWVAITAGAAADVAISRHFGLRVRLDAGIPVVRPSFALEHVGPPEPVQVFQPAPVFAVLRLEPELRFPATDSNRAGH